MFTFGHGNSPDFIKDHSAIQIWTKIGALGFVQIAIGCQPAALRAPGLARAASGVPAEDGFPMIKK